MRVLIWDMPVSMGQYITLDVDNCLYIVRVERLWRDVWIAVSCFQYDVLHELEEDGLLDIANALHLFCVHFVFLPRLQTALKTFVAGWNNHPLRSERNRTPEQLWNVGHLLNLTEEENLQVI